jgi:hypothetical protein
MLPDKANRMPLGNSIGAKLNQINKASQVSFKIEADIHMKSNPVGDEICLIGGAHELP